MFGKKKSLRIVLGMNAFSALARGGEVTVNLEDGDEVKMILQDIGFDQMLQAIDDASKPENHYKPVTIEQRGAAL